MQGRYGDFSALWFDADQRRADERAGFHSVHSVGGEWNSGQFLFTVKRDRYASSFQAKYAELINGTPATWVMMPFTNTRSVQINGLTPAATYTIQVRAIGPSGNSDWSEPVTRICT